MGSKVYDSHRPWNIMGPQEIDDKGRNTRGHKDSLNIINVFFINQKHKHCFSENT